MLLSATLADKSLKNAVDQFYIVHQKQREILKQTLKQETEKQKEAYKNNYSHWHGLTVAITDGTYLQLQDTPEI